MANYMTRQRRLLLEYLGRHHDECISAEQIACALAGQGVSVSAVYRNLSALERDGKIRRVSKEGSRTAFYRYTDAECCRGSLHLSCNKCGRTYHMDAEGADMLIRALEQNDSFAVDPENTVLYGVCAACRGALGHSHR